MTISTTSQPATDLGFLLHKHPDRVQRFGQAWGSATVVYPQASVERCTAALLLEVDAIALARTRGRAAPDYALAQYVNDRPYAASSLLAVALGDVFRTARAGRCSARPELPERPIALEITVPALPCRGGPELAHAVFAPLGWSVEATPIPLDPAFPGWGSSRYVRLRLTGTMRLASALNHLYVLLPVLDDAKHYWVASDEVDKLVRAGGDWLAEHPERELITRRYLRHRATLTRSAFERLAELGDDLEESLEPPVEEEIRIPLQTLRREAVLTVLDELAVASVIDLGCGSGQLVAALLDRPSYARVTGVDVSTRALALAARRLQVERMPDRKRERLSLFQGSLSYADERLRGYDAAVLMEVIEHVDPARLDTVEHVVFGDARPQHVVVTTPNVEYNVRYEGLTGMRHSDHRFEWTRGEFRSWAQGVATRNGYAASFRAVGDDDPELGPPTQMAVFTRG